MQELFGQSSFDNERLIIDQSIKEARGHQIPWKSGPPPRSDVFAFRTPELFTPEETLAIDKDIDEGLQNGTYIEVSEQDIAMCLARRPVRQQDKFRIIDNARPVNLFMDPDLCSVQYEDIRWARIVASPFMSKLDLKKGYRQLPLDPNSKPFFSFMWRGRFYQFQVMAFGDASAPKGFTKFMRGFALRWRKLGILCIIYLDDILIAASTFEQWFKSIKTVLIDLFRCGVRLGVDKLFLGPYECLEFLGVFIDYSSSSLFISAERLHKVSESCEALRLQPTVLVKDVQAMLGLLSFFSAAYNGMSLFRRSLDLWVAKHAEEESALLTEEVMEELSFWSCALPHWSHRTFSSPPFINMMMITDASESAWAGIIVQGGNILVASWDFLPETLVGTSSTARELYALLSFFKIVLTELKVVTNCRLQVQIDNKGAGIMTNKSKAKASETIDIMRELLSLQELNGVTLVVDWRERTDSLVSFVDVLSKANLAGAILKQLATSAVFADQGPPRGATGKSEWALGKKLFQDLCGWAWGEGFMPDVDLFATASNRQVQNFCSRFFSAESLGNAFSFNWDHQRLYAFPPWSQVPECVRKISASKGASVLFITKFDRSSPAWPILLGLNPKKKRELRREAVSLCFEGAPKGHPPFDLIAFVFET